MSQTTPGADAGTGTTTTGTTTTGAAPARASSAASPQPHSTAVRSLPDPSSAAVAVFGARLPALRRYGELLASDGVDRGLIGPREVPQLWDRHLVNSALVAELLETGSTVVDVGSGAGLPGLVLALVRPDLRVRLVEPMARRTEFLSRCRSELELDNVTVVRGRAEDRPVVAAVGGADVVVARAVAPLDRLAGWCLPLLRPGGRLLAIKGASAEAELARTRPAVRRLGGSSVRVRRVGGAVADPPATVVEVVRRDERPDRPRYGRRRRG